MSFGESFARGYAVGDSMRKKKAAADYFKKMKEISDLPTEEEIEAGKNPPIELEGTTAIPAKAAEPAIPGAATTYPLEEPPPVTEAAVPAPEDTAVTDPKLAKAEAAGLAPEPTPAERRMADEPPPPEDAAIPMGEAPVPAAATAAIESAPGGKIDVEMPGAKKPRSLTRDDIKELDNLAMEAARASGDPEMYTSLQNTTNNFIQGKVLRNLGLAMTASQNGDIDATEKYLKQAYRYVPDGQEIDVKREGDKLMVNDPFSDKPSRIAITPDVIGFMGTMIYKPEEWAKYMREERRAARKEGREERGVAVDERRVDVAERQVGYEGQRVTLDAEKLAHEKQKWIDELDLAKNKDERDAAGARYDHLAKAASAARDFAYADYLGKGGSKGGKDGKDSVAADMDANEMRQYGESVDKTVDGFLRPVLPADPNNYLSKPGVGPPPAGYEIFVDKNGAINSLGLFAKDLGGSIGIANPELGPAGSARVGLELARAMADKNGPQMPIYPDTNEIGVQVGGQMRRIKVPPVVMASFVGAAEEQAKGKTPDAAIPAGGQ